MVRCMTCPVAPAALHRQAKQQARHTQAACTNQEQRGESWMMSWQPGCHLLMGGSVAWKLSDEQIQHVTAVEVASA